MSEPAGRSESTPVIILGMHRSGTSCLTGSLQQMGLYLDKVFEWNRANLKGNRENEVIMYLNNAILEASGGSWREVPDTLKWDASHIELRDRIIEHFRRLNKPVWGFKDPRALVTYPFWSEVLPDMRNVGTFRHPLGVAESLNRRNDAISLAEGLRLWQRYNEKLLGLINEKPFPLVCFDVSKDEYLSQLDRVARYLGLTGAAKDPDFFDDSLRRQQQETGKVAIPTTVQSLYQQLQEIYHSQGEPGY